MRDLAAPGAGASSATLVSSSSWREVDRIVDLVQLFEDDVNVVVLRRPRPPELGAWLDEVARTERSKQALAVEPGGLADGLVDLLHPLPAGPGRDALRDDLLHLADVYTELLGIERLGLRLNVFAEDMCPRFHTDKVMARLICTYSGPGTEYLDVADVDRPRLGKDDGDAETSGVVGRERARVRLVPTFAVGLLKGEAWPGNEGRGAVHRSPSVVLRGARRVLLTIDGLA